MITLLLITEVDMHFTTFCDVLVSNLDGSRFERFLSVHSCHKRCMTSRFEGLLSMYFWVTLWHWCKMILLLLSRCSIFCINHLLKKNYYKDSIYTSLTFLPYGCLQFFFIYQHLSLFGIGNRFSIFFIYIFFLFFF